MGSPISGTMAEVCLQQRENSIIKHPINAKILSFYTRYVDDIFLIHDSTRTNPDNILQYIDIIHSSIQVYPAMESTNNVYFLDLSITRRPTCIGISIFRKPTSTYTINFLSNHPLEHKMAACRFLIRRMLSFPLNKEQQYKEWQHILHIAHSNEIPLPLLTVLRLRIQRNDSLPKSPTPTPSNKGTKWATFTYSSPQIRKITNIFKHTNIRIVYKCSNTISHLLKPANKTTLPPTPYDRCGIYALTCMTCKKAYVGQTSRRLKQR